MDLVDLLHFCIGFAGGLTAYLVLQGILSLRVYRLNLAVATLQQAILSLKTQGAAKARWNKEDQLAQELSAFKAEKPANERQYANDPIPY